MACWSEGFPPPVIEVLPSRQQGVVRISVGSTPGYGDTVFQTGDFVRGCPRASPQVVEMLSSTFPDALMRLEIFDEKCRECILIYIYLSKNIFLHGERT